MQDQGKSSNFCSWFKQISSPTSVDNCLYCNLISSEEQCLVTVGGTHVEVYCLVEDINTELDETLTSVGSSKRLKHFLSFDTCERIEDVTAARFFGDQRDSLLLSFRDAKVSVVHYDPAIHEMKTLSLHNYEHDHLRQGRIQFSRPPLLRVDPDQRCAVLLVYDRHLAILPFRRDPLLLLGGGTSSGADWNNEDNGARISPVQTSYVVNLATCAGEKITNIIDMQFLNGYYEPTLLILYEPIGTWTGRVSARQDTCAIAALSLNLQARTCPVIWFQENLPYDCCQVIPVPKPISGVIILSVNSFIFLNQSQPPCGISVNSYVEGSTAFPMRKSHGPPIALDCCRAKFFNSDQIAIVLKTGDFYILTLLINQTMRTVTGIHYVKRASTALTQALTFCGDEYVFLGSRMTDSVLLKLEKLPSEEDILLKLDSEENIGDTEGNAENAEVDALDLEVYGENSGLDQNVKRITNYLLTEKDRVLNLGPINRITCGDSATLGSEFVDRGTPDCNVELVTSSGWADQATLCVIHRTMRPVINKTFELPDFSDVWALYGPATPNEAKSKMDTAENIRDVDTPTVEEDASVTNGKENAKSDTSAKHSSKYHQFLLLTREDSTMVLEAGTEIVELESSGFSTVEATIFAGNIGNFYLNAKADFEDDEDDIHPYIIQICPNSVRLLMGAKQLEHVRLDSEWRVRVCSLADPYALLCTEDDELFLVHLQPPDSPLSDCELDYANPSARLLKVTKPKTVGQVSVPTCFCLHYDNTGFLERYLRYHLSLSSTNKSTMRQDSRGSPGHLDPQEENSVYYEHQGGEEMRQESSTKMMSTGPTSHITPMEIEDEDMLLYGESMDYVKNERPYDKIMPQSDTEPQYTAQDSYIAEDPSHLEFNATHWAFIVFTNGVLEIYSLPDFQLVFEASNFVDCPAVLIDSRFSSQASVKLASQSSVYVDSNDKQPTIQEVLVKSFGRNKDRIILFVRTLDEVILYEAFTFSPSLGESPYHLANTAHDSQLRWRRLPSTYLLRPPRRIRIDHRHEELLAGMEARVCLRPFDEIGGHSGVFVAGRHPVWMISNDAGHVRSFPFFIDGVVPGFTPLHMAHYKEGFAYFNHVGELRIASFPPKFHYGTELGVRKIPLDATPQFLQYHIKSKTFVMICSRPYPCNSVFKLNSDGDKELEEMDRDERCVLPLVDKFYMEIISPTDDWALVPHAQMEFEPWEMIMCMSTVHLTSQETHKGVKDHIAIGTNLSYGEEIPVRGKILILDVIEVVPEPGQPLTRHKVKMIYDQEQKGPVTALSSCEGFLVAAIGQKIYIWTLKDSDLVGVAFVDSEVYIHSLHCLKNLILAADVLKSIQLLRFQPLMRVLSLVSKDNRPRQVYASDFLVDGKNLGFMVTDNESNLLIFSYEPQDKESKNGRRLLRKADMHLPSRMMDSLRLRNRLRDPALLDRPNINTDLEQTRHSIYMGSADGGLYRISPIRDKMLSRLRIIEKNLVQSIPHYAGLHPKAARQYRYSEPELVNVCGNIADGDLLFRYLNLPHSQRVEIAKKAGQSLESIMDDITELEATTLHF